MPEIQDWIWHGGSYLCFVDSDDYIERNMVEGLYQNLLENQADICVCTMDCVGFKRKVNAFGDDFTCVLPGVQAIPHMLCKGVWGIGGKLISAKVLQDYRFEENVYWGEDLLFFYRIFKYARQVSYIPDSWYHYVYREGSTTYGEFSIRNYMMSDIYETIYTDVAQDYPELVTEMEYKIIYTNRKLAIKAAENKGIKGKELYSCIKKSHKNIRRYVNKKSLALFVNKKVIMEILLLYSSAEAFWLVIILYKSLKGFLKQ